MFERRDTSTAGAPKPGRRAAERTLTAFDSHQLLAPIFLVALAAAAYLGWRLRVELIALFGAGLFGIALYKLSRWLTVIWAMVSFYLAWGGRSYMNAFLLLFPPVHRDTGRDLADALCTALPWWLVGRAPSAS